VAARRRIARAEDDSPVLPRIVERKPAPGESHPLPKRALQALLPKLPVEYLYGLKRIELHASRKDTPFGEYRISERVIFLYLLPMRMGFPTLDGELRRSLRQFKANIKKARLGYLISWPDGVARTLWFYSYVFTHELGHHFVEQYKNKNSRVFSRKNEELIADLHARRFTEEVMAVYERFAAKTLEDAALADALGK